MITTEEEFNKLPSLSSHYKPEKYLVRYKFSQDILLDFFCSEYMVWCYEDYYYDDISIDMITYYQPHIDRKVFLDLWNDLDLIREVELYSKLIIEILANNKSIVERVNHYDYASISDTVVVITKREQLVKKYIKLLETNTYARKYNLLQTYFSNYDYQNYKNTNEDNIFIVTKAKEILTNIPHRYSQILPL